MTFTDGGRTTDGRTRDSGQILISCALLTLSSRDKMTLTYLQSKVSICISHAPSTPNFSFLSHALAQYCEKGTEWPKMTLAWSNYMYQCAYYLNPRDLNFRLFRSMMSLFWVMRQFGEKCCEKMALICSRSKVPGCANIMLGPKFHPCCSSTSHFRGIVQVWKKYAMKDPKSPRHVRSKLHMYKLSPWWRMSIIHASL